MSQSSQPIHQVIGHRGAAGLAPENTFAAFNHALSLGCRYIEFDVMLSADGVPYVIHDTALKRTTNGRGEVGLVNADYLDSLDAGQWYGKRFSGEKIPHFVDVLKWMNDTGVSANIEIKPYPGKTQETTIAVLEGINRYWPADKLLPLVSCFDFSALQLCRQLAPEMPLGMLMHVWDKDWLKRATEIECYSVHLNRHIATAARVKEIKDNGYIVLAYTVNWKRQANQLLHWGVDAVFSDFPDLLL